MSAAEEQNYLAPETFDYLRTVLRTMAGIALTDSKTDLLAGRLRKRLLDLKLGSLDDYGRYLKSLPASHDEWQLFLNCLTTNKTDFFREDAHFHYLLKSVLPEWLKTGNRLPWRLWSVPCSTGEEPYTLAMLLDAAQATGRFEYSIAASDIDTKVLPIAKNGVYRRSRLVEVPPEFHRSAFSYGTGEIADWIRIKDHLKAKVSFKQCNLIAPPYPWDWQFDVIFCRNVLIYFSPETITAVVSNLYEAARPGAYLFVGHSEALQNQTAGWVRIQPSIYQKKARKL